MISLDQALRDVFEWAKLQDFAGHDPHDLLSSPLFRSVNSSWLRLIALQLGRKSVLNLHTLLHVPRSENAKALALFISGLSRAKKAATPDWDEQVRKLGERLVQAMHDSGGWGYPFPWQSRTHYLERYTPNIVTTAFAGNALLDLYDETHNDSLLEIIDNVCRYITECIPRVETKQGIAFGYAKNDPQIVFNASLLGGEFLAYASERLHNSNYCTIAEQAAEFVVQHQEPDGSWFYGLEPSQRWLDSFHTGFVIVSLKRIGTMTNNPLLLRSAEQGYEYYHNAFLEPDFAIGYFPHKRYPIDAHALGQAMTTFCQFGDIETAKKIAAWSIQNMRSANGYFYYQRHRLFTNRIPYMRWSNAWMFRGLSEIIYSLNVSNGR